MTTYWWLAITQSSCAASSFPLPATVKVSPVPETLLGYVTQAEQLADQALFLHAPIKEVEAYQRGALAEKVKDGVVQYKSFGKSEKPQAHTTWMSE